MDMVILVHSAVKLGKKTDARLPCAGSHLQSRQPRYNALSALKKSSRSSETRVILNNNINGIMHQNTFIYSGFAMTALLLFENDLFSVFVFSDVSVPRLHVQHNIY